MTSSFFAHEYDLASLSLARPRDQSFGFFVTPWYKSHYEAHHYEPHSAALVASLSRRMELLIDVGASYGFYSLVAATSNPQIKLLSFEPVPETCQALRHNIELNRVANASIRQLAVSSTIDKKPFNIALASDSCGFFDHPNVGTLRTIEVETTTIDAALTEYEPCPLLIKIDTEGNELAVLAGMSKTLERFSDIRLIVEFCPKVLLAAGTKPLDLIYELERLGFSVFMINEHLRKIEPFSECAEVVARPDFDYANLYCVRESRSLNVTFFVHSSELLGSERVLLELVEDLIIDQDAICSVVLPSSGPLQSALKNLGATTFVVPYGWWTTDTRTANNNQEWVLKESIRSVFNNALPVLRKIKPDIIWTQSMVIPWGAAVAEELRVPHVWYVTEFGTKDHGFSFFQPLDKVTDSIQSGSDFIFTCSKAVAEELFQSNDEVEVLYCVPKVNGDASKGGTSCFSIPSSLRLAILGTVMPTKGQEDIVRAVAKLVNAGHLVELAIAGHEHAEYRKELNKIIEEENISRFIKFIGVVDDPSKLILDSDIVVSCSRYEAFGRTPVEAMLLGKATIIPNVGGGVEYTQQNETSLYYSPGNVDELASCVKKFIDDPTLKISMGTNGRLLAKQIFNKQNFSGKVAHKLKKIKGHPRHSVMPEIVRGFVSFDTVSATRRNDPCPCGSGKRFKHCHGSVLS